MGKHGCDAAQLRVRNDDEAVDGPVLHSRYLYFNPSFVGCAVALHRRRACVYHGCNGDGWWVGVCVLVACADVVFLWYVTRHAPPQDPQVHVRWWKM